MPTNYAALHNGFLNNFVERSEDRAHIDKMQDNKIYKNMLIFGRTKRGHCIRL